MEQKASMRNLSPLDNGNNLTPTTSGRKLSIPAPNRKPGISGPKLSTGISCPKLSTGISAKKLSTGISAKKLSTGVSGRNHSPGANLSHFNGSPNSSSVEDDNKGSLQVLLNGRVVTPKPLFNALTSRYPRGNTPEIERLVLGENWTELVAPPLPTPTAGAYEADFDADEEEYAASKHRRSSLRGKTRGDYGGSRIMPKTPNATTISICQNSFLSHYGNIEKQQQQWTDKQLEGMIDITLTETSTMTLLHLPSLCVALDSDAYVHVSNRNKAYEELQNARQDADKFTESSSQTLNNPQKLKEVSAVPPLSVNVGVLASIFDIHNSFIEEALPKHELAHRAWLQESEKIMRRTLHQGAVLLDATEISMSNSNDNTFRQSSSGSIKKTHKQQKGPDTSSPIKNGTGSIGSLNSNKSASVERLLRQRVNAGRRNQLAGKHALAKDISTSNTSPSGPPHSFAAAQHRGDAGKSLNESKEGTGGVLNYEGGVDHNIMPWQQINETTIPSEMAQVLRTMERLVSQNVFHTQHMIYRNYPTLEELHQLNNSHGTTESARTNTNTNQELSVYDNSNGLQIRNSTSQDSGNTKTPPELLVYGVSKGPLTGRCSRRESNVQIFTTKLDEGLPQTCPPSINGTSDRIMTQHASTSLKRQSLILPKRHSMYSPRQQSLNSPGQQSLNSPRHNSLISPGHHSLNSPRHHSLNSPRQHSLNSPRHHSLNSPTVLTERTSVVSSSFFQTTEDSHSLSPEEEEDQEDLLLENSDAGASKAKKPYLSDLFHFKCPSLTRGLATTCLEWNHINQDLLAVSYGDISAVPLEGKKGRILCWSLKNPSYPERVIETNSAVLCLSFSFLHPNLLASATLEGMVAIWDLRHCSHQPVLESGPSISPNNDRRHTDGVWDLHWVDRGAEKVPREFLSTISLDGHVMQWSSKKGLEQTILMSLKKMFNPHSAISSQRDPNRIGGIQKEGLVSRLAGGTSIDFHTADPSSYLVGTYEGLIHRCSTSYNEQYLESYIGHSGPVYKVRYNPYNPETFLSCSEDWTIRLWHIRNPENSLETFHSTDLCAAVNDISWCPTNSTGFAAAMNDGRVELWDLSKQPLDPIVVHYPNKSTGNNISNETKYSRNSMNCVRYSLNSPVLVAGDAQGCVTVMRMKNLEIPGYSSTEQQERLRAIITRRK